MSPHTVIAYYGIAIKTNNAGCYQRKKQHTMIAPTRSLTKIQHNTTGQAISRPLKYPINITLLSHPNIQVLDVKIHFAFA